jgi:hypothetical protein
MPFTLHSSVNTSVSGDNCILFGKCIREKKTNAWSQKTSNKLLLGNNPTETPQKKSGLVRPLLYWQHPVFTQHKGLRREGKTRLSDSDEAVACNTRTARTALDLSAL